MSDNTRAHGVETFKDNLKPFSARPPTVSAAVWAQLLRGVRPTKDGSQSSLPQPDISHLAPPTAPVDRNATSMRILLHDTQSNFERFTVETENLFRSISETKTEIKTVGNLYAKNREALTSDIIDLVNRSQREIQRCIAEPSQASSVKSSFNEVNGALHGINQRLDSIQSFNETHSRALQTQMQSIQMLLENQGKIITAVTPLLPLLQALPPHLETLRGSISQSMERTAGKNAGGASTLSSPTVSRKRKRLSAPENHRSPLIHGGSNEHSSEYAQDQEKRTSLSGGMTTPKGPYRDHFFGDERDHEQNLSGSSRSKAVYGSGSKRLTLDHEMSRVVIQNVHERRLGEEFTTPRRPLVDACNSLHHSPPPMMRKASITSNTGNNRPTPTHIDRALRRLASAAPISSDRERMPPPNALGNLFLHGKEQTHGPTLSEILRVEKHDGKNRQEGISNSTPRHSVGHPTPVASHKKMPSIFPSPHFFSNGPGNSGTQMQIPQQASSSKQGLDRRNPQHSKLPSSTPKNAQSLKSLNSLPFGPMNLKTGRSIVSQASSRAGRDGTSFPLKSSRQSIQQGEGRRFIPLVDSDDDIEDDIGE